MINEKGNSPEKPQWDVLLLPPRFDEHTASTARPVEPLPHSRLNAVGTSMRSLFHGSNARALVLIVILGLGIGALGGLALVKTNEEDRPAAHETVSELTGTSFKGEGAGAAVLGTTESPKSSQSLTRSRRGRSRAASTNGAPRAYRVAVIR